MISMKFWIATSNLGKLREYERLLDGLGLEVKSLKDFPTFTSPPENGKTFLDNARIKARSFHAVKPTDWVLGEDSGLEVTGLNGMPGVFSARYAGDHARDIENTQKVLKMLALRSPMQRQAQFKTVIVLLSPDGKEHSAEGVLKGNIIDKIRGTGGFGYDPIFIPEGETRTLAELTIAEKNQMSHRAKAFAQLRGLLENIKTESPSERG